MAASTAWGIDIGNRALKAVKLVREGDALRVEDFAVIEHETVLSNAGDNREALIQTALTNFVQNHPIKGASVSVGVSGQSSFARFIKLPPVETKKIPEIVRFEAIQQIPFPLDDVEWSYQLFQNPESPEVEVGIFAMRKELVSSHIKLFTDVDMNVQVVQMNPLAVYNAMQYENRFDGTTMIIDLGAENTDLIIADNDTIWLRSISIGGNSFTETLMKAFKLDFRKAEDLKRNAATSKYARQIFQAMRPVFADLVAEIQRSVGFYASVHRDSRIRRVLALGATFKLPGLQKYLQQNLALDVERLDSISAAPAADSKVAPAFNENVLSLLSAYGLAIQALGGAKVTSSLLPEAIRREKMWKEKTKWFAATAAMFVAGAGIGYGSWFLQNTAANSAEAQGNRQKIEQVLNTAKDLDSKWESQVAANASPEQAAIKNIMSFREMRAFWARLFAFVGNSLPQARAEILKLQPQLGSGDPTKIKQIPRGERMQITIDSVQVDYVPNATELLKPDTSLAGFTSTPGGGMTFTRPSGGGIDGEFGAGGGAVTPEGGGLPADAPRALFVTMRVKTPYRTKPGATYRSGHDFVQKELVDVLKQHVPNAKNPKLEFSIPKAEIRNAMEIEEDKNLQQELKTAYENAVRAKRGEGGMQLQLPTGGGGIRPGVSDMTGEEMGGGYRPGAGGGMTFQPEGMANGPQTPDETAPFKDRVYPDETVLNDWQVTVVFVVQIDPPAFAATPPAEGAPSETTPPADQAAAQ